VTLSSAAPTFKIRLIVHANSAPLSYYEAKRILKRVEEILCDACASASPPNNATGTKSADPKGAKQVKKAGDSRKACDLQFTLLVEPKTANEHPYSDIPATEGWWDDNTKDGLMSSSVMQHIVEAGAERPKVSQEDDPIMLRLVPGFVAEGPTKVPPLGSTIYYGEYKQIFLSIVGSGGGRQQGRSSDWFTRQAQVWAHELGHYVGLKDRPDKDPCKYCIMYMYDGLNHLIMDKTECDAFERFSKKIANGR
jgi:hypothetical protein